MTVYNMYMALTCRISMSRYLQPPSNWVSCALESRELLAICLKKLKGLSKVCGILPHTVYNIPKMVWILDAVLLFRFDWLMQVLFGQSHIPRELKWSWQFRKRFVLAYESQTKRFDNTHTRHTHTHVGSIGPQHATFIHSFIQYCTLVHFCR